MTRNFNKKEIERQEYIQHHSSTKYLNERISILETENEVLKKQIKELKKKLKDK